MESAGEDGRPAPERHVRYRWAASVLGGRVLDAACGAGWGTAELARSGAEAVGVDLSPGALAAAREAHGGVARFVEGNLLALPLRDGEFDGAVCFEALAQVAEPARALDELRRVLRPGGTLLVSAPNPAAYPGGNPLHLSELAPAELERLLEERFANVALHRQQTYFASLLGEVGTGGAGGMAEGAEAMLPVARLASAPAGAELHAVAAASDGELPPAPVRLALGEDAAYEERQRPLESWRQRAVEAEAEACALQRKLRELQS